MGAATIIAVDALPGRLVIAQRHGTDQVVDFTRLIQSGRSCACRAGAASMSRVRRREPKAFLSPACACCARAEPCQVWGCILPI